MKVMLIDSPSDPVRIAFAQNLYEKRPGMKNDDGTTGKAKYEMNAILKPGGENAKRVEDAIAKVMTEKYGTKLVDVVDKDGEKTGEQLPAWLALWKHDFADDQKGLRKGNLKRSASGEIYDGFEGNLYVYPKNENRPGVFNRAAVPVVGGDDGAPYSGCYGNVEIDIWALNKPKVTKRIVIDLLGVQFSRDGDSFGAGSAPSKASSFANLSAADEPANAGGLLG
ncbi:MAG TPA: ssDNA-binding protein [Sphingomonas sp.]|jgi:hypothetical protein